MGAGGDYTQLGNMAFRRFGPAEDSERTITVVAPAKMKDYFEVDSEVPVAPFPTTHRELQSDEEAKPGTAERAQPHALPLCWLVPSVPQPESEGRSPQARRQEGRGEQQDGDQF